VCDLETSRMGAPYIYDISRLRVNRVVFVTLAKSVYCAAVTDRNEHQRVSAPV